MLQGTLTAESAPAPHSGISVKWDYCANIIICHAVTGFLLLRCILCCYMNWWRGKVELQLCSLGIICRSTTLQKSTPLHMWLCRLLLCPSTCFNSVICTVVFCLFILFVCLFLSSGAFLSFYFGFFFVHSVHFTSDTSNWHLYCAVPFLLIAAVHNKFKITSSCDLTIVIKNFSFFPSVHIISDTFFFL